MIIRLGQYTRYTKAELAHLAPALDRQPLHRPPGLSKAETEPTIAKLPKIILSMAVGAFLALGGLGVADKYGLSPFQGSQKDRPALLTSIQDLSEYHAAVGNFEVVTEETEKDLVGAPDFVSGRRTLLVTAGTVNAFVDMSDLTDNDLILSDDGKSVKVRLPEPQLDKPNIDHSRTERYDLERGIVDRVADASNLPDDSQYYVAAEAKMAATAEESELLKRAAENTRAAVTGMFGALDIQVTFID
ncbi:DUF4230 domain-containing protein [Arthrobacter sp. Soc17.1.1.1]|uniref:DUF4230 domain-containing protein n=1 Tax=Arthrobacter sp. Soc17.1.1.1 TaxID=3121277 RepID=UPI002FE4627D